MHTNAATLPFRAPRRTTTKAAGILAAAHAAAATYDGLARTLAAALATGRRNDRKAADAIRTTGRDKARAAKFATRFGLASDRAPFEPAGFDEADL